MFEPLLTINLANVNSNKLTLLSKIPSYWQTMAVLKANAYGFGAEQICSVLNDVDSFAVARLSEALDLKKKFPNKEFVVFSGGYSALDFEMALNYDLTMVIHSSFQLDFLKSIKKGNRLSCWVKFDSGMHRLGFDIEALNDCLDSLAHIDEVEVKGIMSHFSSADTCLKTCQEQVDTLMRATEGRNLPISMTNSAGLLNNIKLEQHVARFGLALYGISPFLNQTAQELSLKPVYKFSSYIISIREHQANEPVGYNQSWSSKVKTRIAVIAAGYADGYPRNTQENTPVLINGKMYPIVGNISMDLLTVEIGFDCSVKVGDEAVLWGDGLPLEVISKYSNRIPYDLITGISKRVKRIYI